MAKVIMVQGTMSNAGKSLIAAGLCRVFHQDGYRVAPFKSQNMALNSFITKDGLEMGRAQVMQAEAAGIEPDADMNPILLKPSSQTGSQVIVGGKVRGNMRAADYFQYKKSLIPEISAAFQRLEEKADIIVIEGAGSPAEINLRENDIVNMGLAELVDAPVLLVGDIDPGGVFAQLIGTLVLLEEKERRRVGGLIINKFRGDKSLLDPGITMLEEKGGVPVVGVLPYMDIHLDDEDSLSSRLEQTKRGQIDLAVVRLPHISNFTDFSVFDPIEAVSVRYIRRPEEMDGADLLILPGTKNTIADRNWLREAGFDQAIKTYAEKGGVVFGICGGFQMLGTKIEDPHGVEEGGRVDGLGLLPCRTVLKDKKTRRQENGRIGSLGGVLRGLSGSRFHGYEIHMGETFFDPTAGVNNDSDMTPDRGFDTESGVLPDVEVDSGIFRGVDSEFWPEVGSDSGFVKSSGQKNISNFNCSMDSSCKAAEKKMMWEPVISRGNVYGTYIHGIFDEDGIARALVSMLAARKGVHLPLSVASVPDYHEFKEAQYDALAQMIRDHMDMDAVYSLLREAAI